MKQSLLILRLIVPLLAFSVLLRADGCNDISKLGEKWHGLADYIDKRTDNGKLRKSEAAQVRAKAGELLPGTRAFAKVLIEDFSSKNKDEARAKSLGKQLQANLEELSALGPEDDWDDVGTIIDKIGDVLDKLADICS